jgi:hypothetical protein
VAERVLEGLDEPGTHRLLAAADRLHRGGGWV